MLRRIKWVVEKLQQQGWQDFAEEAYQKWTHGEQVTVKCELGRYLKGLVDQTNWEVAQAK